MFRYIIQLDLQCIEVVIIIPSLQMSLWDSQRFGNLPKPHNHYGLEAGLHYKIKLGSLLPY